MMAAALTRRTFLMGASALLGGAALPRLVFAAPGTRPVRDVLVMLSLRGGMDGLNVVVPYADAQYYRLRPDLALFPPDSGTDATLPLDGYFGLNPDLAAIEPLFHDGKLAFVHATGLRTSSRSHFECQARVARGDPTGGLASNWLDRHLATVGGSGFLRSVAAGAVPSGPARGSPYALGVGGSGRLGFGSGASSRSDFASAWSRLYGTDPDLGGTVRAALEAAPALATALAGSDEPEDGAGYPDTSFGRQLRLVARLIRADLGLELACVELGGWDTHDRQAPKLSSLLQELGAALLAFDTDLGARMAGVDVVALTEFGRRAAQNASLGTDHGSGSLMLLLGGGVAGGQVYTLWPGLAPSQLRDGDLDVTIDFRTVLAELLAKRLGNTRLEAVFPGYAAQPSIGAFRSG